MSGVIVAGASTAVLITGTTTAREVADSNLLACKWNRRFHARISARISECVGDYQQD
jgi:hypothetical protein